MPQDQLQSFVNVGKKIFGDNRFDDFVRERSAPQESEELKKKVNRLEIMLENNRRNLRNLRKKYDRNINSKTEEAIAKSIGTLNDNDESTGYFQ